MRGGGVEDDPQHNELLLWLVLQPIWVHYVHGVGVMLVFGGSQTSWCVAGAGVGEWVKEIRHVEARQGVWRQGKVCGGKARCVEARQGMWR